MEGDLWQTWKIFSMDFHGDFGDFDICSCGSSISIHIHSLLYLRNQSSVRSVFFDWFSSAKWYCPNQGEQKESKSAGGRRYRGLGLRVLDETLT